jgi:hypothetical protein
MSEKGTKIADINVTKTKLHPRATPRPFGGSFFRDEKPARPAKKGAAKAEAAPIERTDEGGDE